MGKRTEPRKDIEVTVRIFGTDRTGAVFSDKVVTVNISRTGVELAGVQAQLKLEETIGLSCAANRANFRVKWIGEPGTPKAGHLGLLNVSPEKPLWDFPLPLPSVDAFQPGAIERRKHSRFRCQNPVEIHVQNGTSFWGTVADLSLGGCYVEMPIPLQVGTKLKIGLWIGQAKVSAEGEVAHRTPGLGIGIKFNQITDQDLDQIRVFLGNLAPFAQKRAISSQRLQR
jgi:hypothetical protein